MAAKRSSKKKSTPKTKKQTTARKPAAKKTAKKASKRASSKKAAPRKSAGRGSTGDDRLTQLEQLVEMMVQKDVVEVELEEQGARWRVRRTEPQAVAFATPSAMPVASPMPAAPAAPGAPSAPDAAADEPEGELFTSPMLVTFYSAPSPDAETFVKVGDRVNADSTLCIVEAMKVMNEIKAEREFEVLEVLVKNGEPVEFGQPLFRIR